MNLTGEDVNKIKAGIGRNNDYNEAKTSRNNPTIANRSMGDQKVLSYG